MRALSDERKARVIAHAAKNPDLSSRALAELFRIGVATAQRLGRGSRNEHDPAEVPLPKSPAWPNETSMVQCAACGKHRGADGSWR